MKIAVTGAAGHLGSHLCRRLAQLCDYDLVCIDMADVPEGEWTVRKANLADLEQTRTALDGVELVVHCASIHTWKEYSDEQYMDLNVKGTWNVYSAAREMGLQKVVLTSSIAATGYTFSPESWPVREGMEEPPNDIYSFTKMCQERIAVLFAKTHEIETLALRPPMFMPHEPVQTGADLLGSYALVEDMVEAHIAAIRAHAMPSKFESFFTTSELPYGPDDAELAKDPWALAERYYPGTQEWFTSRGVDSFWLAAVYSLQKARDLLGWEPKYNFDWWWSTMRQRYQ